MTSGIVEILRESTPIQVLVGTNALGNKFKIYPVQVPQGENTAYMTVHMPGNDPVTSLTKDLASSLDYPSFTVNCWAVNFRYTELMAEAVRSALDNTGFITDAGYTFNRIWLSDEREGIDPETRLYLHAMTYRAELSRLEGDFYGMLSTSGVVKWGGLWNWAAHSNAYPTSVVAGQLWVTQGDVTLSGQFIPDNTIMIALQAGADAFDEFSFNL